MSDDPFLSAQADLLTLLHQARPQLSSYLRIRSSAPSAASPELAEARHELETTLTDLSTDLQDLVDSVKAVEGDPYRYGLDVDEVSRRRRLVADVAAEVEGMRQRLQSTVHTADDARLAHPDSFAAAEDGDPLADAEGEGTDQYGAWEEQRQMEMLHEQDEALDGVFQTVGNLRMQADTMGRELEEQAEMLEETENVADRVGGKLGVGMKRIRHMVERNEDSHPLLRQTPLTVNPFLDLPKPPTLPHTYASLPSTLPPSLLNSAPTSTYPDVPAYVTSTSGAFTAHPSTIIAQNEALLRDLEAQSLEAGKRVREWTEGIRERELAEKRRRAPGWLDSEQHLLQPERKEQKEEVRGSLMDEPAPVQAAEVKKDVIGEDLGNAMDRAFGGS